MSRFRDPPRWLENEGVAHEVRRDLAACAGAGPSAASRTRMFAKLEEQLALTGGSGTAVGAAAGAAGAGVSLWKGAALLKAALAAGVLFAGAVAGVALWSQLDTSWLAPSAHILVQVDAESAGAGESAITFSSLPIEPRVEQAPETTAAHSTRNPSSSRTTASSVQTPLPAPAEPEHASEGPRSLATPEDAALEPASSASGSEPARGEVMAELALLARARRALLARPARALELAAEHARIYGRGTFEEEREVLAIEALLKLAREPEARTRVQAFQRRFPSSAHRVHLAKIFEEHAGER